MQAELEKTLNRFGHMTEQEEKLVRSMAQSIISKLLHRPFTKLKQKAVDDQGQLYADIVNDLFGLNTENATLPASTSEARKKAK